MIGRLRLLLALIAYAGGVQTLLHSIIHPQVGHDLHELRHLPVRIAGRSRQLRPVRGVSMDHLISDDE